MNLLSSARSMAARLSLIPIAVALCLMSSSLQAHAGCGLINGAKGSTVKLPAFPEVENEPLFVNPTIVGLWKATYTNSLDHSTFNESFKSWHADGLEFESAYLSPEGGNVCTGVWKYTDFRTVKLHHLGWLYNSGTPTATATSYFTVDEIVTVAPNGKTYTGTFTFKVWNLDGTATPVEVKGTIAATRINP